MKFGLNKQHRLLFYQSAPAMIAIIVMGIIEVQIITNHPFANILEDIFPRIKFFSSPDHFEIFKRMAWNVFQLIPAFTFGSLSDTHHRKKYLVFVQIIGVVFGLIFIFWGFNGWIIILFGLTFNPLSVARAAILDNYNRVSAVQVIALTYFFKWLPWLFVVPLTSVTARYVFIFLTPILAVNTVLAWLLFRDRYDTEHKMDALEDKHEHHENRFREKNSASIWLSFAALGCAETTFYFFWVFLEDVPSIEHFLTWSTVLTFIGFGVAWFYKKVPHLSFITKLYFALFLITLLRFLAGYWIPLAPRHYYIVSLTIDCLIGGFYLPLATDGLIELCGARRRATGSAWAEASDSLAVILSGCSAVYLWSSVKNIFVGTIILYGLAALLQKLSGHFVKIRAPR